MDISRRPGRPLIGALLVASALAPALAAQSASAIVRGAPATGVAGYDGSFQRIDSPREDLHVCGATLIAPRWAITAGHCTNWLSGVPNLNGTGKLRAALAGDPVGWRVRFGSRDTRSGGQPVAVERFVRISWTIDPGKDIALLRLARPVRATPATIATRPPTSGTPAHLLGWGYTGRGGLADYARLRSYPRALRAVTTEVAATKTCGIPKATRALCIGVRGRDVGPDNMDSGGPVLVSQPGKGTVIAGTVNGGNLVGGLRPAIYTDLSAHRRWIADYVSGRRRIPATPRVRTRGLAGTGTIGRGGCSATVVRVAASRPTDPAMMLTNGHCVEPRPAPGTAVADRPSRELVRINDARGNPVRRAATARLMYATMTGTDVALYRLTESYADLAAAGVRPLTMGTTAPAVGARLTMLTGSEQRTYGCRIGAAVPILREAGWEQRDALRYADDASCRPIPGTSGAPLVDPRTREIVAVHNTHVRGQGTACDEGEPCEVTPTGGTTTVKDGSYAQQTVGLTACIVAGSRVDLAAAGCRLPRPR